MADARIQQSDAAPVFDVDVDRTRAQQLGLTERDVTNSLVVAGRQQPGRADLLAESGTTACSYPIVMQTPQYQLDSLAALRQPADQRRDRRQPAGARRPRQLQRAAPRNA